MKNNKRDNMYRILFITTLFVLPLFIPIIKLINNTSDALITKVILYALFIFFSIIFLITFKYYKNKKLTNYRLGKILIITAYVIEIFSVTRLVFYNDSFKEWLVTTSNKTIEYKDLATSIYNSNEIKKILDKNNKVVDLTKDIIDFPSIDKESEIYKNKYEEEILKKDDNELYKIIKISGTTIGRNLHYEGYMAVIYDPSKVKLAKSSGAGTHEESYGEVLTTISKKNNAIIAINAGGFYDPNWNSNGGIPHGDVFIDGKLDSTYARGDFGGGIVGFNKENKLILKNMTTEEAIEAGIRDAVDWGPYLIVDGDNKFKDIDYFTWVCARTAIGQRKDGIVLMVVIDGLQSHSAGASYADMAKIMETYGAVNAANLDGGTSTAMTYNHEYINSPWNGYKRTYRYLPNAFIVTE